MESKNFSHKQYPNRNNNNTIVIKMRWNSEVRWLEIGEYQWFRAKRRTWRVTFSLCLEAKAKVSTSYLCLGNPWSISWRPLIKSQLKILLQLQKSFWSLPLQWHPMAMVTNLSPDLYFFIVWRDFFSVPNVYLTLDPHICSVSPAKLWCC